VCVCGARSRSSLCVLYVRHNTDSYVVGAAVAVAAT